MSNWSSYQLKFASGFRNVVQAIQNHFTSNDISFEAFRNMELAQVQAELQGLPSESDVFSAYAGSIQAYANLFAPETGSFSELMSLLTTADQQHFIYPFEWMEGEYASFEQFRNDSLENYTGHVLATLQESEDFYFDLGTWLVEAHQTTIWDGTKLSFGIEQDREVELLMALLKSPSGGNTSSFRVALDLVSNNLTDVTNTSAAGTFRTYIATRIIRKAQLTYAIYGEGNTNADLWEKYLLNFSPAQQNAILLARDQNGWESVFQLSESNSNELQEGLASEFFVLSTPYYQSGFEAALDQFSVQHRFIGQLVEDDVDNTPLASWNIAATDTNDSSYGDLLLGNFSSNNTGYFDAFFTTFTPLTSNYNLSFKLTNPATGQEVTQVKAFNPSSATTPVVFSIAVDVPVNSASIAEVNTADDELSIDGELSTYLSSKGISYLEDIRRIGGLATQNDLPEGFDTAVNRMDSHANLELLKADKETTAYLPENVGLIENGFTSIRTIAQANRYEFVGKAKPAFAKTGNTGQYTAGKVYEQASGIMAQVNTTLNGGLANNFRDFKNDPDLQLAMRELADDGCNCDDCRSGVSPLAYLADLINYTLKSVSDAEAPDPKLDLADLQRLFKHPFADLPADCSSVSQQVCQVRVCIEVLWTHISDPDNGIATSNDLHSPVADALKNIRLQTYELLLTELGTSYEEMRRMKVADLADRTRFANRLGLPENKLNEFILDHSSTNDQINDVLLEELFGYRDTSRNYKTYDDTGDAYPNALMPAPKPKLLTYKEEHLRAQFHTQDFPEMPYSGRDLPLIDPDIITADDFVNPQPGGAEFDLWQKRFDWLSATANTLNSLKRKGVTIPKSNVIISSEDLSDQTAGTTVELADQDDNYVTFRAVSFDLQPNGDTWIVTEERPPAITPLNPGLKVGGVSVLAGGSEEHALSLDFGVAAEQKSVFNQMREPFDYFGTNITPWTGLLGNNHEDYFELLYSNLKTKTSYSQTVIAIKNSFALSEEQFLRLYTLYSINKLGREQREATKLTAREWEEVINLMLVAIKNRLETKWKEEELGMSIDTRIFWNSLSEPISGLHPFPYLEDDLTGDDSVPLVEPELINEKDLPDYAAGKAGKALFTARKNALTAVKRDLRLFRLGNDQGIANNIGFDPLMEHVFGASLANALETTANDLAAPNAQVNYLAEQKIATEYHLTINQFAALIALRQKATQVDPAAQPTEEEWNSLFIDLSTPYKIIHLYPDWRDHEADVYFDGTNLTWQLRKARLAKWRSDAKTRSLFKKELELVSRQPLVDPHLITPINLHNLSATNPVFQLWKIRKDDLQVIHDVYTTSVSGNNLFQNLNAKIESTLGIEINYTGSSPNWVKEKDDLAEIKLQQDSGVNVKSRLLQLGLSSETFDRLYRLRELVKADSNISYTDAEQEDLANILLDVYKKRQFSLWNSHEESDSALNTTIPFALSPDFFQLPPAVPFEFPPKQEAEKPRYLFHQKAYRAWKRNLESRERVLESTATGLSNAVSDTEDALLIPTRDALIEHLANAQGSNVETTKDWISRNLLIDSEMQCCSSTTRVTQAIEALQLLLWGLHNEVLLDEPALQNLSLQAPGFENEWKWLGSYATWRAAMFVQLYPENILMPELKSKNSHLFLKYRKNVFNNRKNKYEIEAATDLFIEQAVNSSKINLEGAALVWGVPQLYNPEITATAQEQLFIVAGSGGSKNYYQILKESNKDIVPVKFWDEVDVADGSKYAGHVYFTTNYNTEKRCVFIYYRYEYPELELTYKVLNLETAEWEDDHTEKMTLIERNVSVHLFQNIRKFNNLDLIIKQTESSDEGELLFRSVDPHSFEVLVDNIRYRYLDDDIDFIGFVRENGKHVTYMVPRDSIYQNANYGDVYRTTGRGRDRIIREVHTLQNNGTFPLPVIDFRSQFTRDKKDLGILPVNMGSGDDSIIFERDANGIRIKYDFSYDFGDDADEWEHLKLNALGGSDFELVPIFSRVADFYPNSKVPFFLKKSNATGVTTDKEYFFSFLEGDSTTNNYFVGPEVPTPFHFKLFNRDPKPSSNTTAADRKTQIQNSYNQLFDSYIEVVREVYFFMPMMVGRMLQNLNEFEEALKWYELVYDKKLSDPKLAYELVLDESRTGNFRDDDWLEDPLNPHVVASTRSDSYTEYTLQAIANLFLSYANHEFTQDDVESIARAKQLYLEAEDLIRELKGDTLCSSASIANFDIQIGDASDSYLREYWIRIKNWMYVLSSGKAVSDLLTAIENTWNGSGTELVRMQQIETQVQAAVSATAPSLSLSAELDAHNLQIDRATNLMVSAPEIETRVQKAAGLTGVQFQNAVLQSTGFSESTIESSNISMPFFETKGASMPPQIGRESFFDERLTFDVVNGEEGNGTAKQAQEEPERVLELTFNRGQNTQIFNPSFGFCVPKNPIIRAFELQVQINLYKIRNCMNISGIKRPLNPFAAPTDSTSGVPMIGVNGLMSVGSIPIPQASAYRYDFLVQRAKELINITQQIEGAFLSALEKLDDENYSLLKARQDLATAKANVKLQDLRIDEAESGIKLASLQTERAEVQIEGLQAMLDAGFNEFEARMLGLYQQLLGFEIQAIVGGSLQSTANLLFSVHNAVSGGGFSKKITGGIVAATGGILGALGIALQTANQINSAKNRKKINTSAIRAAQARREQEWNYQQSIARQDVKIGKQQEQLAQDRLRIVTQEKSIAELQTEHSEATIDYLLNQQFTSAALYEYMIEVLERVYSYFLQEATANAKLARNQLAFERQQNIPEFIKGDYWQPESEPGTAPGQDVADRKGITGSTRLLQDVYRLDQFATQTDQRKQQLSKTISLATLAPFEFEQFKETGLLTFSTDMPLFDRDFPGHYLRLIKRVNTSVIALVPPIDGIRANLSSIGLSRVVTSGPLYQTQYIRRNPETISLSSPSNDTGVLELQADNNLLRPFEGSGVDSFWEFRMEKAANPNIDYSTVADILITFEYEALSSFDYRAQVVKQLNTDSTYEGMLPISFRNTLPDQWFDIVNPDQASTPFSVSFDIDKDYFPVNVSDPVITNVLLFFPQDGEEDKEVTLDNFSFTVKGSENELGEQGLTTNEAKLTTADANVGSLNNVLGKSVEGTWKLTLTDTPILRQLIEEDQLNDVLMVLSFEGVTPKYHL